MGISLNEMFEMNLWQFVCYMEGYKQKLLYNKIENVILSYRIGQYTGQYWTGKKAPDPNKEIEKEVEKFEEPVSTEKEISEEEKIEQLKRQLKYFK